MSTEKQILANRENAKKSTGPRTPAGKAVSSQNARRHVILTKCVTLGTENSKRFQSLVERFHREYQPQSPSESALVDTMATARWRILRMVRMEVAGVDYEYEQLRNPTSSPATPQPALDGLPLSTCASLAYRQFCANSRSLDLLNRFESRLHRQFDSAFDRLLRLRTLREKEAERLTKLTGLIPPPENYPTNPISGLPEGI